MAPDIRAFQESINSELIITRNRVRNLIGDANWAEEGRYKEAVLKNILKKFLPTNLSVGTGFIVDERERSRQMDIIIYDNQYPVLFSEGDFIITTKKNVKALIEVKSRLTPTRLGSIIQNLEETIETFFPTRYYYMRPFIRPRGENVQTRLFFGIFAFEFGGQINNNTIDDYLIQSRSLINHLSLGPNHFIRRWHRSEGARLAPPIDATTDFYNFYELDGLSFSYFISNLLDIVCGGLHDRHWFSFPIHGTKEIHRIKTVPVRNLH